MIIYCIDIRPKEWRFIGDMYDENKYIGNDRDTKCLFLDNFLTRSELNAAYSLYAAKNKVQEPETIIGLMNRIRNFPLSKTGGLLQRIKSVVEIFLSDSGIKCPADKITLVSEQIISTPPGNVGQQMHLDTWESYPTVIIYLTAGKSTRFANYDYYDVSKKHKTDPEMRYPFDWNKCETCEWNVAPGDLVVFWSNFPHCAPPNTSKVHSRLIYYAAFTGARITNAKARALTKRDLECPVYQSDYVMIAIDKPSRNNRNIYAVYYNIFSANVSFGWECEIALY